METDKIIIGEAPSPTNHLKCPHCGGRIIIRNQSGLVTRQMIGGPDVQALEDRVTDIHCSKCKTTFHISILETKS